MPSIKAIVFDLDDTLLQTSQVRYALVKKVGKVIFNQDITDEMIRSHWGKPFHVFVHDLYGVDDFEKFAPQYMQFRDEFPSVPYDDAVKVVTTLLESFPVGIVSAASKELIMGDLSPHGFPLERFFYIQSSEDTSVHKPDPGVFLPTLAKLREKGIETTDVLYVGDGLHDYHAAHGAGLQFIGIAGRTTQRAAFDELGARTIQNLSQLLEILY